MSGSARSARRATPPGATCTGSRTGSRSSAGPTPAAASIRLEPVRSRARTTPQTFTPLGSRSSMSAKVADSGATTARRGAHGRRSGSRDGLRAICSALFQGRDELLPEWQRASEPWRWKSSQTRRTQACYRAAAAGCGKAGNGAREQFCCPRLNLPVRISSQGGRREVPGQSSDVLLGERRSRCPWVRVFKPYVGILVGIGTQPVRMA